MEQIKKQHMKYMYGKARQYIKRQQQRERKIQNKNDNKSSSNSSLFDRVGSIAQSILIDQESQLMFGFGFDQFIQDLKEKRTKDTEGEYLQKLQQILHKLQIKNDTELIQLYKYVIAKETRDNYRNEARKIIIKRVIQETQKLKSESKNTDELAENYLDFSKSSKEFVLNSLNNDGIMENVKLQEELEKSLKDSQVDTVASNLAISKLEKKIEANKEQESNASKKPQKIFDSEFSDDADIFELNKKDKEHLSRVGIHTNNYIDNLEDWKADSVYQEIKQNFKRNKLQYEEEQSEIEQQENDTSEFFSFLQKSNSDQEIQKYLRKFRLTDELMEKPDFGNILENIDYLIDSAPISLKSNLSNDSKEFRGVFAQQELSETDMLWQNFNQNFMKIFPSGTYQAESQNQNSENQNIDDKLCAQPDISTIYEYSGVIGKEENIRNHVYNEKDLSENERVELEVYRRIQKDPFFTHYIQNDLRYFSERMLDGYSQTQRLMTLYDKTGDIMNYNDAKFDEKQLQILDLDEPEVEFQRKQQLEKEIQERVFANGKRKTSHCRIMMTKGSGKVTINRLNYLDYFPHPILRNICLKSVYLANVACQFDIDIQVRGGGQFGQAEAISVGVTRAIVKQMPHLRYLFIKQNMIQTDPRKKERKKVGQYKARKAWTYVRR
ncbi:Ribosomal protein S5 domain 2-type fold [Pseudocohnilembus persalinus]|uniref:Ribosomal protein S5 domain 2-type fold n=1 Tax=Pseudocohnilembus persalinus TaxID=266149 RepID=A0A0V0QA30_PSEPJ|nr:Ribosomal protein S5 domain 2-type fold [Pseudocohnilembus persalinus]|eukprot:KRW99094.1 Ribosomal protein S5 domain 2-type fold [Pseudocohnilembus persalinus]